MFTGCIRQGLLTPSKIYKQEKQKRRSLPNEMSPKMFFINGERNTQWFRTGSADELHSWPSSVTWQTETTFTGLTGNSKVGNR